jgi:hypothetical protein
VLPEQLQGPGWAVGWPRAAWPGDAAPCAPAWQAGCLILVPGRGKGSAPVATANAGSRLAVATASGARGGRLTGH